MKVTSNLGQSADITPQIRTHAEVRAGNAVEQDIPAKDESDEQSEAVR